ncbi:MAG TPA: hypothetical protein VIK27_01420 [Candidatus Aquilonibacter sp.]
MSFLAALAPTLIGAIGNGADNAAMSALNQQDEQFQLGLYADQVQHQEQMSMQSTIFDQMMDERSENMREVNTLRDIEMQSRKADNDITKKFIQSITE